jgi:hypothetical protein
MRAALSLLDDLYAGFCIVITLMSLAIHRLAPGVYAKVKRTRATSSWQA